MFKFLGASLYLHETRHQPILFKNCLFVFRLCKMVRFAIIGSNKTNILLLLLGGERVPSVRPLKVNTPSPFLTFLHFPARSLRIPACSLAISYSSPPLPLTFP